MEQGTVSTTLTSEFGGEIQPNQGIAEVGFMEDAVSPPGNGAAFFKGVAVDFVRDPARPDHASLVKLAASNFALGVVVADGTIASDTGAANLAFAAAALEPRGLRLTPGDRVRFHAHPRDGQVLSVRRSRAKPKP